MPSPSYFYVPPWLSTDDYSICSDTDSTFSDPRGQPGPGRFTAVVLSRLGHKLDILLSSAAERLGFGQNAMMRRLLWTVQPASRCRVPGGVLRRPRQETVTAEFFAMSNAGMQPLTMETSAHLVRVCRKLVSSIR